MVTFAIVLISLFAAIIEIPRIRRQKLKKEMWVFAVFMVMMVTLCIAQANGFHIPSVLGGMEYVYKPLSDLIFKWLT